MKILLSAVQACNQSDKPFDLDLTKYVSEKTKDPNHQDMLRKTYEMEKPERDKFKIKHFPAIAPTAYFKGGGSSKFIKEYRPYIFLDIDGFKTREEALVALAVLKEYFLPHLIYADLSVSQKGIHLVIHVDEIKSEKDYFKWWDYLQRLVKEQFDLNLDKKTRLVGGKMIAACHPEYNYFNPDATPMAFSDLTVNHQVQAADLGIQSHEKVFFGSIDSIIKSIEMDGITFSGGCRHNFIVKLAARCNKAGIPINELLATLNQKIGLSHFPEHEETIKDIYERYKNQFGEYKHRAEKQTGHENKINSIEKAISYLNGHFVVRHNTILDKVEYRKVNATKWIEMNEYLHNSLWKEINKAGIYITKQNLLNILNSDHSPQYDAFRERIEALPVWDGNDHIDALVNTLDIVYPEIDDAKRYIKMWVVALVACMYDGKPNHTVLTFMGGQGIGKTKWLQRFILSTLADYFYAGALNPGDKDAKIRVAESFLIVIDELESTARYTLPLLKELITCEYINERRPYAARTERLRRRASFAATVNLMEFLKDTTGSRRFLVIEVTSCDHEHTVDMDMVFAQAFHLYKSGFKYYFTAEEGKIVTQNNERFQVGEPIEEFILKCFRLPIEDEKGERFTVTQIGQVLFTNAYLRVIDNKATQIVGNSLVRLGFKKTVSRGKGYYWLVKITDQEQGEKVPAIETYPSDDPTATVSPDDFIFDNLNS